MTDRPIPAAIRRALVAALRAARTARLPQAGPPAVRRGRPDLRVATAVAAAAGAVLAACSLWLPRGLPPSILLLGLEVGGLNALPALGLVLVWRANRVVNFAQGELGAVAASLAFLLMLTLRWPWAVAVPLSVAVAGAVGAGVEVAVARRFFQAPKLVLTVATIGVAQVLGALRLGLPGLFPRLPPNPGTFPSPFSRQAFALGSALYSYDDVLVLVTVPAVTAGLALWLRGTWAGLGARLAAENLDRARLLGIPVRRLSTVVWGLAGLLGGLTAVLRAPVTGFSLYEYGGSPILVRALAPAALGGFTSLPGTFVAALVLGVVEQAFFWNFSRGGPLMTLLLVVLLLALLVRARQEPEPQALGQAWTGLREPRPLPRTLRAPRAYRACAWALGAGVVGLLAGMPWVVGPARLPLAGLVGVQVVAAASLVVLTGWAGQVSLGHWALVGVGAFVAGNAMVRWDLDLFATLALAAAAGGLVALALGAAAARLPGVVLGATTLAFAVAAQGWIFELPWVTAGARPRPPRLFGLVDLGDPVPAYWFVLGGTLVALGAARNLKRHRLADALRAVRDNPRAAEALGLSARRLRLVAFLLSGCLAGYAGVLYVLQQGLVAANRFPAEQSLALLSAVVLGGLGSVAGAVAGAVVARVTQYLLPAWVAFFTTGVGMLVVLLVLPGGLGEVLHRWRWRAAAWLARRAGAEGLGAVSPVELQELQAADTARAQEAG